MGFGVSIFLIAVGAVLAFAVSVTAQGIDLDAVGVILMIVGSIGLLASFIWGSGLPWRRDVTIREREVVDPDRRTTKATNGSTEREVVERRTSAF